MLHGSPNHETIRNNSSHTTHQATTECVIFVNIETGKLVTAILAKRISPLPFEYGIVGPSERLSFMLHIDRSLDYCRRNLATTISALTTSALPHGHEYYVYRIAHTGIIRYNSIEFPRNNAHPLLWELSPTLGSNQGDGSITVAGL
jgi:hypothetical protein